MKNLTLLSLIVIFLSALSCKKEEVEVIRTVEVEVEEEPVFQKLGNYFPSHSRFYNLQATDDFLYIVGEKLRGTIELGDSIPQFYGVFNRTVYNSLPMSDDLMVDLNDFDIEFYKLGYKSSFGNFTYTTSVNLPEIDDDIQLPRLNSVGYSGTQTVISGNHVLYPYRKVNDDTLRFCIFDLDLDYDSPEGEINVTSKDLFAFESARFGLYSRAHYAVDDGFLFQTSTMNSVSRIEIFKITYTGEIMQVGEQRMISFFSFAGDTYGINDTQIFKFIPSENRFFPVYSFDYSILRFCQFREIDGQLFGFVEDRILVFTEWNTERFKAREIKKHNLAGLTITDLEKFGDDIYISTFNGIFKRNFADFAIDMQK